MIFFSGGILDSETKTYAHFLCVKGMRKVLILTSSDLPPEAKCHLLEDTVRMDSIPLGSNLITFSSHVFNFLLTMDRYEAS